MSPPAVQDARFALRLPVALAAIEEARLALLAYLEPQGIEPRVINRIEVVLEELVSNVVRHAAGAGHLAVAAECDPERVRLTVEDDGFAFDPFAAPEPAVPASLAEAPLGGQGIALIRRLSHTVRYARIDGRNHTEATIARG